MNLHVIIGEDDFLVAEAARKIIKDGVGLEVIDSVNSGNEETRLRDIKEADASFSTPPFLEPSKVTWWKNVKFLPGSRGGKEEKVSEAVKAALERFVNKLTSTELPDNQHFILSGPSLLKTSTVAKKLALKAEVVVFAALKPWEQKQAQEAKAIELAAELGLEFAPGVQKAFIDVVGVDTRSIMSELNKLKCYLGEEKMITYKVVGEITSPGAGVEPEIWGVTNGIGERNAAKFLDAIKRFEGESGFDVRMTNAIERLFRDMPPRFASNWTALELKRARARFFELRERAVSGGSVNELIITEALRAMRKGVRA